MSILLTTIQAAEYIGISPALMKKMRADGKGPRFYRIGKSDWANTLKMYEKIKKEHFKSQESREVDKLIARAKGMLNQ